MKKDYGKIALTPGGLWNANTPYEKLTTVSRNGQGYLSFADNQGVDPEQDCDPITGIGTKWFRIATKGDPGTTDYNELQNKPFIPTALNDLTDDATHRTVTDVEKNTWNAKADKVSNATNGNFAGLDANGNLTNSGKKASDFATAEQGAKADTAYQVPQGGIPESDMETAVQQAIDNVPSILQYIEAIAQLVPEQASSENQLADKAFVNSSIQTNTADFKGTRNLVSDLSLTTSATQQQIAAALASVISSADNNDYCFVQIPTSDATPTQIARVDRYKYNGSAWLFEWSLNNSSFTAEQWAAINSTVTSGDVDKLRLLPTKAQIDTLFAGKQNTLISGTNIKTINGNSILGSGNIDVKNIFIAEFGVTTYQQILDAYNAGKYLVLKYDIDSNPDDLRFLPLEEVLIYPDGALAGTYQFTFATTVGDTTILCYVDMNGYWQRSTRLQQELTFDTTPTAYSNNPVRSWGIKNALDNKQDLIEDLSTIRSGAAAGATAYQKPSSGIPASDIAAGVIPDVSNFITNSVNNLVNYYLKSETYTKQEVTDLIGAINQFHYEVHPSLADITTPESNVLYLIGPQGAGTDLYEEYVYPNSTQGFTKIGDTSIDLSGYVTLAYLNTELVKYAKTNEYYPEMRVGSADKVLARIEDTDTYLIRETGGTDNEVLDGEAPVLGFEGNATGWNQLVQNGSAEQNGTLTRYSALFYTVSEPIVGHKYYERAKVKTNGNNIHINCYDDSASSFILSNPSADEYKIFGKVFTCTSPASSGNDRTRFRVINYGTESTIVYVKDANLIDLTLLNSDLANKANLTVADVEDYLAHNIGLKPYYPYNPGTLLPANIASVSSIKSVNLLNPTTKQARLIPYSTTEGVDNQYTVKRLPDDAALSFTPDVTGVAESVTIDSNGHFVIPSVGTLSVVSGGNPYSGDVSGTYVCMTWDGTKDSTPDSFEEDVAEIDFAEIYSDNNGVKTQVCPTGMKMADYAGTVRDKLILDDNGKWEFVKNVGDVDLGGQNITWETQTLTNNANGFKATISGGKGGYSEIKMMCSMYKKESYASDWGDRGDKCIWKRGGGIFAYLNIVIHDSTYASSTDTQFKSAMSGVMLYYELATPVTYTNLYYKTGVDTYVPLEDYILATYVNNWATQSVNTYPYVDGTPVAIPPRITQEFIIDQEESLDTIKGDIIALSENKEDKSNKVTSLSSNSTDVQYPSAKCVYDAIQAEIGAINTILDTI